MDYLGIVAIIIMSAVTYFLRALPFIAFKDRKTPAFINYLGKYLPYSVMAMLVVYCLKGIKLLSGNHGIPELVSSIVVVILHVWKKNTVLSVILGTACYMLLIRIM